MASSITPVNTTSFTPHALNTSTTFFPSSTNQNLTWDPATVYGLVFGILATVLSVPGAVIAVYKLRQRRRAREGVQDEEYQGNRNGNDEGSRTDRRSMHIHLYHPLQILANTLPFSRAHLKPSHGDYYPTASLMPQETD